MTGPSLTHLAVGAHSMPTGKPRSFRQVSQSHQRPHVFCATLAQISYPSVCHETVSVALAHLIGKQDSQRWCLSCCVYAGSPHL